MIIQHQTFGEMEQVGSNLGGVVDVGSHEGVSVFVSYSAALGIQVLDEAAKTLARIDADELLDRAVAEYLDNYNKNWSEEDEPLTAAEFRERLELAQLIFYDDHSAAALINCDGMFQGHQIRINIQVNGKPGATRLAG